MVTKKRKKIFVVYNSKVSLTACKNALKEFYEVYPVVSALKLFEMMKSVLPDLVLLDTETHEMNGYEVIKMMKEDSCFKHIPVVLLASNKDESSELEGFDSGAADYISKPFSAPLLLRRVSKQLAIKDYVDSLKTMVREKTAAVISLQNTVFNTVTGLVGFRDRLTGDHVTRTQHYLRVLIDELIREGSYAGELMGWDIDFFLSSAQLHDVGKIAITDHILNKPGKLTSEEFEIMKTHVPVGVNAIKKIMSTAVEHSFLRHTLSIVGAHHEKWDGSGYPKKLKGRDIPLEGRLMAIIDVYDALVSERPYKKSIPPIQAAAIIKKGRGTHFDPLLVDAFNAVFDRFLPPT